MYYLIYKITNTINGKIYIGSHKTNNINDAYMGSGKYLKHAINKHGIEKFTKEILFSFDNPDDMYKKEAEIVNEEFISESNTYNLKKGGFGGFDYINSHIPKQTEWLRKGRLHANNILEQEYGENWRNVISNRGNTRIKEILVENPDYLRNANKRAFLGKTHSEESKKKIGSKNSKHQQGDKNSNFGNMWITNGIDNKLIKKTVSIPEGWMKGRVIKTN